MDYQSVQHKQTKKMANETHQQKMWQQKEILTQQSNFKKEIAEQKLDYNDYQNKIQEELQYKKYQQRWDKHNQNQRIQYNFHEQKLQQQEEKFNQKSQFKDKLE
jgi:hypothetical protein